MTEPGLVERLREAHRNSQQRVLGSNIFAEAADEIEHLTFDRVDKADAWDAVSAKGAEIAALKRELSTLRNDVIEECAREGYRVCAEIRHVTLGDRVAAALRALKSEAKSNE